jgi:hypothetical protein
MKECWKATGFLTRFWEWTKRQIIRDVPEEITLCEYDCHEEQCSTPIWEKCDRRLSKAAGELMPQRDSKGP